MYWLFGLILLLAGAWLMVRRVTTAEIGYSSSLTFNGTKIGQTVDFRGPSMKGPAAQVTNNDSPKDAQGKPWHEKIPRITDAGQITFNVIYFTTPMAFIMTKWQVVGTIVLTYPDAHTWTCQGFLTDVNPADPMDDKQTIDITYELTGNPVYA
jgi:hypothetical protein